MDNNFSRIRIKDIAGLAGVSPGTVDRVLHNRGEVSVKTREKILGIISEMDYHPDILASALANKKEVKIASLIPREEPGNRFWRYPLAGIEDGLNEISHFGISLDRYFFDYFNRKSFLRNADEMLKNNPQGIILAPVFSEEAIHVLEKCSKQNIPVVMINANVCTESCLAFVGQDSFQSGVVSASLMQFGLSGPSDILVVNFIREEGNQDHILKREEGFRRYYSDPGNMHAPEIHQLNIVETSDVDCNLKLKQAIEGKNSIGGIFVTNSRVYRVAGFLEKNGREDLVLIGYDLLNENKTFLKKGVINFLISQKPHEQGYKSIIALYRHLVLKKNIEKNQYLPIDIITRENLEHYNFT